MLYGVNLALQQCLEGIDKFLAREIAVIHFGFCRWLGLGSRCGLSLFGRLLFCLRLGGLFCLSLGLLVFRLRGRLFYLGFCLGHRLLLYGCGLGHRLLFDVLCLLHIVVHFCCCSVLNGLRLLVFGHRHRGGFFHYKFCLMFRINTVS